MDVPVANSQAGVDPVGAPVPKNQAVSTTPAISKISKTDEAGAPSYATEEPPPSYVSLGSPTIRREWQYAKIFASFRLMLKPLQSSNLLTSKLGTDKFTMVNSTQPIKIRSLRKGVALPERRVRKIL